MYVQAQYKCYSCIDKSVISDYCSLCKHMTNKMLGFSAPLQVGFDSFYSYKQIVSSYTRKLLL